MSALKKYPANTLNILEVELKDFESSKVAYNITEMIYLFFGIEAEGIPYTKETNGIKSIDIEPIKSM